MDKLVLKGLTHPGEFELSPGFNTVGRNPTNDFRVPDSTVSSFHCEIIVSENLDAVVRDLNSTNGTFIDGQPIQESPIRPGQVLRLGSAEVKVEEQEVAEPIHVAIPEIKVEAPPASVTLPDGALACLNHSEIRASLKCVKCQKVFCNECVHVLKLSGGKTRAFCPSCSGPCELLPGAVLGPLPAAAKKQSLLGRLTQTIRIRLK
jgi:hypothetical protein